MIDLNRLRHALAVAAEGSLSAAAEVAHVTQPALTRGIQMLEADYGIRIFDRGRTGVKLTTEGAEFISIVDELVRRIGSADEQLRQIGRDRPAQVTLGIGSVSAASFLPAVLPSLALNGIRLRIQVAPQSTLSLQLHRGDIDFFISGMSRAGDLYASASGFQVEELPGFTVGLVVRSGHPLLAEGCSEANLAKYPVVAGSFVREAFSPLTLERIGLQQPAIELDDYNILASLVRQSDYIMISSEVLIRTKPELGLVLLDVPADPDILPRLALVSSTRQAHSPAAAQVASLVAEKIRSLASGVTVAAG